MKTPFLLMFAAYAFGFFLLARTQVRAIHKKWGHLSPDALDVLTRMMRLLTYAAFFGAATLMVALAMSSATSLLQIPLLVVSLALAFGCGYVLDAVAKKVARPNAPSPERG